ncbi:uncharacterized protein [Cherax quadricarinatus]|uniref:uncharacterized protein isoform X1 n=1 Tax=Cherax quadricarinatus TaxID=27406 RepID=UPI00387E76CF
MQGAGNVTSEPGKPEGLGKQLLVQPHWSKPVDSLAAFLEKGSLSLCSDLFSGCGEATVQAPAPGLDVSKAPAPEIDSSKAPDLGINTKNFSSVQCKTEMRKNPYQKIAEYALQSNTGSGSNTSSTTSGTTTGSGSNTSSTTSGTSTGSGNTSSTTSGTSTGSGNTSSTTSGTSTGSGNTSSTTSGTTTGSGSNTSSTTSGTTTGSGSNTSSTTSGTTTGSGSNTSSTTSGTTTGSGSNTSSTTSGTTTGSGSNTSSTTSGTSTGSGNTTSGTTTGSGSNTNSTTSGTSTGSGSNTSTSSTSSNASCGTGTLSNNPINRILSGGIPFSGENNADYKHRDECQPVTGKPLCKYQCFDFSSGENNSGRTSSSERDVEVAEAVTVGCDVDSITGDVESKGGSDENIEDVTDFAGSVGKIGSSDGNIGGSVGNIGGSVGNIGGSVGNIGGSVGNIGGSVGNIGGSVGNIGGSVGNIGGSVGNIGGSVGNIGGSVGNIGGSVGNIGGSVGNIGGCVKNTGGGAGNMGGRGWRIGGSLRKISSSFRMFGSSGGRPGATIIQSTPSNGKIGKGDRKLGGSDGKLGGTDGKLRGSDGKLGGSDGKLGKSYWKIGGSDGRINSIIEDSKKIDGSYSRRHNKETGILLCCPHLGDDMTGHNQRGRRFKQKRNKSEGSETEEAKPWTAGTKEPAGSRSQVGRAFSFSPVSRSKPTSANITRVSQLFSRISLRKSKPIFSFSRFLASYIFKHPWRKSSDPTPLKREDEGKEEEGREEEIQPGGDEREVSLVDTKEASRDVDAERNWTRGSGTEENVNKDKDGSGITLINEVCTENDGRETTHTICHETHPNEYETSKTELENSNSLCFTDKEDYNDEVFFEADEDEDERGEWPRQSDNNTAEGSEEDEICFGTGWVKKRVSQIERQISLKKEIEEGEKLLRKKSIRSSLSSKTVDSDDTATLLEEENVDNNDNDETQDEDLKSESGETDGSDTEVEDEVGDIVILRSKSRGQTASLYRYSDSINSIYRYSVTRPRTVIIGLGVCTETQFFRESFGEGVSETESEDDEEDAAPTTTTPTTPTTPRPHSRPPSPSRTSRSHSPLSDMDTESKRNSQAVSTEPSDLEDHSSLTTSDLDSCHDLAALDTRKDKAYRIAHELLHTERTYVKVLHLIDQEFQFRVDHENRAHHMFPHDVIPHMFSNVKSIYKLHHDFLLPQLEERMAQWEQNRRIGDIMKSFAPFLKMYTEYVRNFDNAMTLINQWQSKCPRFAAIMDEIHSMEVCGNLTLQHHMLSPVQRIPRYEMLLRDYLKKLPEDSPDRHDTEKALHLVSTAANHANDAMKKIDKFEKLLEIQESLGGAEDLVSPTRELIKEGKIIKISARSGDHQERYIFLLTDLLLLCSPRLMGGRVMSGPQYRLRAKYHVENLIVQEGDNLETANTFYIKDSNKSVELYTQTLEEKEQWLEAFIRAIHETSQRKSSLKLHFNPDQRTVDLDLGQKQPMLVRSDSVTKCMECGSQFTMVRRKHHCRACGAVVCSKCSSFKASVAYESGKSVRVCRPCHATLQELSSSTATPSPEIDEPDECSLYSTKEPPDLPFRNRGVLEVSAKTGGAVIQGFLQLKTHRKTWVKRWFALHTDFVLYSFKCEADDQALTATPVPGFTVTHLQGTRNESGISEKEKERAFKLHHSKKHYIFQATSKEESQRFVISASTCTILILYFSF